MNLCIVCTYYIYLNILYVLYIVYFYVITYFIIYYFAYLFICSFMNSFIHLFVNCIFLTYHMKHTDPLAPLLWDLIGTYLGPIFANPKIVKIGHGTMGGDIPALFRDFGIIVVNAFDTQEASGILGRTGVGLAALLDLWGCPLRRELATLKDQMKNTDWRIRPMSEIMLQYATLDVHYLVSLYKLQFRELLLSQYYKEEINDFKGKGDITTDSDNIDGNGNINMSNYRSMGSYRKRKMLKSLQNLNLSDATASFEDFKEKNNLISVENNAKNSENWSQLQKESWRENNKKKKNVEDEDGADGMRNGEKNNYPENTNNNSGKLKVHGLQVTDDSLAVHFNKNKKKENNKNEKNMKSRKENQHYQSTVTFQNNSMKIENVLNQDDIVNDNGNDEDDEEDDEDGDEAGQIVWGQDLGPDLSNKIESLKSTGASTIAKLSKNSLSDRFDDDGNDEDDDEVDDGEGEGEEQV